MMSAAQRRDADYRLYFRVMSEGLTTRSITEFKDELDAIAMHTEDEALRTKCLSEMHRFDAVPITQVAHLK